MIPAACSLNLISRALPPFPLPADPPLLLPRNSRLAGDVFAFTPCFRPLLHIYWLRLAWARLQLVPVWKPWALFCTRLNVIQLKQQRHNKLLCGIGYDGHSEDSENPFWWQRETNYAMGQKTKRTPVADLDNLWKTHCALGKFYCVDGWMQLPGSNKRLI